MMSIRGPRMDRWSQPSVTLCGVPRLALVSVIVLRCLTGSGERCPRWTTSTTHHRMRPMGGVVHQRSMEVPLPCFRHLTDAREAT